MYTRCENRETQNLLKRIFNLIQDKTFYNIGVIGMEFADGYQLLHSLKRDYFFNMYKDMSLYILLRLAIDTGYTHGDFHPGNIFINTTSTNYFEGVRGKPLLIDFGQAQKIPPDIMKFMKEQYKRGNYTEALKRLCDIDRPDKIIMTHHPSFYGFACGTYNYKTDEDISDFPRNTNTEIGYLIEKREEEINNIVELFNNKHDLEPTKYPLLPLSNAIKKSMYIGLSEGGKLSRKWTRKNRNKNRLKVNNGIKRL